MELINACFEIIVCLSIVDKELHKSEEKMISAFIRNNFNNDVDLKKKVSDIQNLNESNFNKTFLNAVEFLNDQISVNKKMLILDFVLNLIFADNKLTIGEKKLFDILGEKWEINIQEFFERKFSSF